jgi:hypothetical protein
MANRLREVCETRGIHRLRELDDVIKRQERDHRKWCNGRHFTSSVPVAADYFLVRCFADAFKVLRSAETADDLRRHMCVRTDYLLALAIVAGFEEAIASRIDVGELMAARDLVDYSTDIA